MRRTVAALLVVVASLGSACGGGPSGVGGDGSGSGTEGAAAASTGSTNKSPDAREAATSASQPASSADAAAAEKAARDAAAAEMANAYTGGPTTTTPLRYAQPTAEEDKGKPVPIELEAASCVRRGALLKVTVRTLPDTDIAMIIGYNDGKTHGSEVLGTSDGDGVFSTNIPIEPSAPIGKAKLVAAAAKPDRGGHDEHDLRVVGPEGC